MFARIAKLSYAKQRAMFIVSGFVSSAPFFYSLVWMMDHWDRLCAANKIVPAVVISVATLIAPLAVFWTVVGLVLWMADASSDFGGGERWLEPIVCESDCGENQQSLSVMPCYSSPVLPALNRTMSPLSPGSVS